MHTIKLKNDSMDWLKIKWFKFENTVPDVEAYGISDKQAIYVWLRNRDFDIDNQKANLCQPGAIKLINTFKDKKMNVSYYDAWTGMLKDIKIFDSSNNNLKIEYPGFEKDLLIKIEPALKQ